MVIRRLLRWYRGHELTRLEALRLIQAVPVITPEAPRLTPTVRHLNLLQHRAARSAWTEKVA